MENTIKELKSILKNMDDGMEGESSLHDEDFQLDARLIEARNDLEELILSLESVEE